jgi:D-alanyl-D-alanine carboxypeptidase
MINYIKKDYIELSFIYVCLIITVLFLSSIITPINTPTRFGVISPSRQKEENVSIYNIKSFENIFIKARAYIVYDVVDEKIIASKNENEILPLASLTKIMTGITALIINDENTKIVINSKSIDGLYDLGLKKGQIWKLGELLKYTLVFSSNDGAQIIADQLLGRDKFVEQMNIEAALLGLTTLHFTHPAGLDVNGKIGGEGSVLDFAKLMAFAHRQFPDILDATTKDRATLNASNGKIIGIPNTNQNISSFVGAEASKTGFTNLAGGNLAIITDVSVGRPIVIVVLGSTHEERFSDVETLYKATLESLKK